ncbi:hypothetical protein Tco_0640351 [Tanacetum coccineum]
MSSSSRYCSWIFCVPFLRSSLSEGSLRTRIPRSAALARLSSDVRAWRTFTRGSAFVQAAVNIAQWTGHLLKLMRQSLFSWSAQVSEVSCLECLKLALRLYQIRRSTLSLSAPFLSVERRGDTSSPGPKSSKSCDCVGLAGLSQGWSRRWEDQIMWRIGASRGLLRDLFRGLVALLLRLRSPLGKVSLLCHS